MTTPNQTSPDGAIVIGGGQWLYGQTVNESTARAAFELPMPTPGNMIELLRIALESLPIEALQPFANFLGIVDGVFTNVGDAVAAILSSLGDRFLPQFEQFLGQITNLDNWLDVLKDVIDFFTNLVANVSANAFTIIKELVDFLSDAFTGPGTVLTFLSELGGGVVSAILTQFETFLSSITNLDAWLTAFKTLIDGLLGITNFQGWVGVLKTAVDTLNTLLGSLGTGLWTVISQVVTFFGGITAAARTAWLGVFKQVIDFFGTITNLSTWTAAIKTLIDGLLGITSFENWVGVFRTIVDTFNALLGQIGLSLWTVLSDILTFFAGVVTEPGKTLMDWLGSIPIIGDVVYAITRVGEGDGWQPGDGLTFLSIWIQENLLTQTGKLPIGGVTSNVTNLLGSGTFQTISELSPNEGWVWDSTQSATGTGGSAKVVLDGYNKQMVYRDPIAVTAGTTLRFTAKVKTSDVTGVTGYGWKVVLSVVPFAGTAIGAPLQVARRTAASPGWVEIGGNYTVPTNITSVAVQLGVESATGGTVWFDDVQCYNNDLFPQKGVQNLTDAWAGFWDGAFGSGGLGRQWFDVGTAAAAMTENTRLAKVAGDGAQGNVQTTWNVLVDGFDKTTGSTGKTPADVRDRGTAVRQQADLGVSNASGVQGNVQSTWNALIDGFDNTSGSANKTFNDVRERGQAVRQQANLGVANAGDVATGIRRTLGGEPGTTGVPANTSSYVSNLITKMYGTGASVPLTFINNSALNEIPTTKLKGNISGANITDSTIPVTALDAAVVPGITATVKASTVGTGAVLARINAAGAHKPVASGADTFGTASNPFFNTLTRSTPDITYPTSSVTYSGTTYTFYTGEFVVTFPGWYLCEVSLRVNVGNGGVSLGGPGSVVYTGFYNFAPALFRKPSGGASALYRRGTEISGFGSRFSRFANSSWIVYLGAGDSVQAGYDAGVIDNGSSTSPRLGFFGADNTGNDSYFSIALLNRS